MLKKICLFFVTIFLLVSCYSHKVILNADKKSGTMIIEYDLDDDYFQLLSIALDNFAVANEDEEQEPFDPTILIDEDLFRESFQDSKYLKLKSVKIDLTNGYKGKIIVNFYDFEKALEELPSGLIDFSIKRQNNVLTLTQVLNFAEMDPDGVFKDFILQQKEDDINFYNRLTKKAQFNFIINTATPIKKSEGVLLSSNKKEARYAFKIGDFINTPNKVLKFLISF